MKPAALNKVSRLGSNNKSDTRAPDSVDEEIVDPSGNVKDVVAEAVDDEEEEEEEEEEDALEGVQLQHCSFHRDATVKAPKCI